MQPQGWKELRNGSLMLRLRCPECLVWMVGTFEQESIALYDDELLRGREAVRRQYDALVTHNMQELADRFARALELDLIGPEDFAPGSRRRGLQSAPAPIERYR